MRVFRSTLFVVLAATVPGLAAAQRPQRMERPREASNDSSHAGPPAKVEPTKSVTQHTITVNGKTFPYEATAGTLILKDDDGNPRASMFYVAYTRSDVKDESTRPITFLYNGGPGSASMWLHMGSLGPRRVVAPDAEHASPPPYQIVDNAQTALDVTDLVFVDAVGTGFSKPEGKATGKDFFGVDEDVSAFGQFIEQYLRENARWNSPRYLFGESYGTTRSAALANYLQSHYDMDLNGVMLLSVVLNFETLEPGPGNDLPYVLYLPSYAAVAWYHHALDNPPKSVAALVDTVRAFALGPYAHALAMGSALSDAARSEILDKLQEYTGLSRDYWDKADLRVDNSEFQKELLRSKGIAIGRLDARYEGPSGDLLAQRVFSDPQSDAISSAYVTAFNTYIHNELKYGTDEVYHPSGNVQPWDWSHGRNRFGASYVDVAPDLAQAMEHNPHLEVLVNNGYYDFATPFFATEYTMDHLGLPKDLQSHIHEKYYEAGHMVYVNDAARAELKQNVAAFIEATSGGSGSH
jgi:carboxypeptidase C (cathepsin A)